MFAASSLAGGGADEHALSTPYRDCPVAAQLRPFAARLAFTVVTWMGEPSQVQFAMTVLGGQLCIDLPRRIVQPQLVIARALHFLALDSGKVPVSRECAGMAERRRQGHPAEDLGHDDGLVRVTTEKVHDHLVANPGQRQCAPLVAGPGAGDAHPGRVPIAATRASALGVAVVFRLGAWKTHLDPAVSIAMDFFAGRSDHDCALQLGTRQVNAWIESRNDRDASTDTREPIGVTHAAFVAGLS